MEFINDKYFDKTFCLTSLNKNRMKYVKNQFEKHLLNVQFWYNPTIPRLDRFIHNYEGSDYYNSSTYSEEFNIHRKKGALMCGLGHYNIIKTSYELNYDKILIFEDDITFKKSVNLNDVFNLMPKDYDAIAFVSNTLPELPQYNKDILSNEMYYKYNKCTEAIRSTKMYALNRIAQKEVITMYEEWLDVADLFWNNFSPSINSYVNICQIDEYNDIQYSLIDH